MKQAAIWIERRSSRLSGIIEPVVLRSAGGEGQTPTTSSLGAKSRSIEINDEPSKDSAPVVRHIIEGLAAAGTDKKRASAERVGIPMGKAFGVSVAVVREMAKRYKGRSELADPLWATGYHEARLLAILLADPKAISRAQLEVWLGDVVSWDLCHHLCTDLVRRRPDALALAKRWIKSTKLYVRRAAFSTIAACAVHDKTLGDEALEAVLNLIVEHAEDPRPHVRQAASWAIRPVGKRNTKCMRLAKCAAERLVKSNEDGGVWVGKDALCELNTLVSVAARDRLLTSKSGTARKERKHTYGRAYQAGNVGKET